MLWDFFGVTNQAQTAWLFNLTKSSAFAQKARLSSEGQWLLRTTYPDWKNFRGVKTEFCLAMCFCQNDRLSRCLQIAGKHCFFLLGNRPENTRKNLGTSEIFLWIPIRKGATCSSFHKRKYKETSQVLVSPSSIFGLLLGFIVRPHCWLLLNFSSRSRRQRSQLQSG